MSPVKSAGEGRRGENYRAEGQEVKRHGRKDERRQRNREGKKSTIQQITERRKWKRVDLSRSSRC